MDSQTLDKTSHSKLDKPPDLFSFIEEEKVAAIKEQKGRRVYETPVAIQLPNEKPGSHNGEHRNFRKKARGKPRLIPLGRLQFSQSEILEESSLTKQDAFKMYIWCGLGRPTEDAVETYRSKLPSVSALKEPRPVQIQLNTTENVYVVDLAKKLVARATSREPLESYCSRNFRLPAAVIGRDLAWEEVSVP